MTRPITDTLRLLNGGTFLDQVSLENALLVQAITEHGGTGKLTIEITIKRSAGGAMAVSGKFSSKAPSPKADETLVWALETGELVLDNPKQQKLDLHVVNEAKRPDPSELRNIG